VTLMLHEQKPPLDDDLLAHHGIKGMKWGHRKQYDSHPRKAGAKEAPKSKPISARRAKSIGKLQSRAAMYDTKISDLEAANKELSGFRGKIKIKANNNQIEEFSKQRDRLVKDAEAKKNHKLTSTQKKVLIGSAVAAGIIAGVALAGAHDSGALNSSIMRGSAFLKGEDEIFKSNSNLTGKKSVDELLHQVAKPVNPGYSKAGGKMNCRRATFTYELRRRGYDVAATTSALGIGQSESGVINAVTPGSKKFYNNLSASRSIIKAEEAYQQSGRYNAYGQLRGANEALRVSGKAAKDVRSSPLTKTVIRGLERSPEELATSSKMLKSSSAKVLQHLEETQPEGARGEVLFNFGSFGHSMAYEIVDGKAHIFDSQKGTLYNAATKMVEEKWDGFHSAEVTRLDNVDLDLGFLARWATNAKG
jgi:hypothetical protein